MIINHNMSAANALRNSAANLTAANKSMEKLSSGLKINRAGDNAAGLSISEKMRAQIRGLEQASNNSQDAVSMIQTGEGALNETHNILQRMRELAVQVSNGTNVEKDKAAIKEEVKALEEEITRIATQTEFNTQKMFAAKETTGGPTTGGPTTGGPTTGGTTSAFNKTEVIFQVGANEDQKITVTFNEMTAKALGVEGVNAKLSEFKESTKAITTIDNAINQVSGERSKLGAVQNRLEHTIANLNNASENLTSAESRIRDVDMAKEMATYSKNNILQQAAQAMLAQANQQPQSVLQLLR